MKRAARRIDEDPGFEHLHFVAEIELRERSSVNDLTLRALAKHTGMSDRTVFRYYASREEFLDAVAVEVARNLRTPAPPSTVEELPLFPRTLYSRFEEKAALVKPALHTELSKRMREGVAGERWRAIRALIDNHAPRRTEGDRKIATTNIGYYLSATTWHYYRFNFEFTLEETIASAQSAVRLAIDDIAKR